MGISNFTKLIECFQDGEQWNESFDSILIDIQSELYVAIEKCFPLNNNFEQCEKIFFKDVSAIVQKRLANILLEIFRQYPRRSDEEIVVVCSFDGAGVPMKWPTQRKRRFQTSLSGKNLYRASLFGNNVLSAQIRDDLVRSLKTGRFHDRFFSNRRNLLPKYIRYVVSGCDVEGEGEHKLFHIAESLGLKYPVFVSVDNDAFVLALARIDRYECVQLFNKRELHNLTDFAREAPADALVYVSLLFGNDFLPPVVALTNANCLDARESLSKMREEMQEEKVDRCRIPTMYRLFLARMVDSMRYEKEPTRSPADLDTVAVRFWTTCLWILDYYTLRDFPQKWAKNEIYDEFDRDGLLLVLTSEELATETFEKALARYQQNEIPKENVSAESVVFDSKSLVLISRYLTVGFDEGWCHDIKISTSKRKLTQSNKA